MVWPFTSSSNASSQPAREDPYSKLDPSLRAFLERESPLKYVPARPPESPKPSTEPLPSSTPPPPQDLSYGQSSYPDGRYAYLWSTYRPLAAVENETKTDQEKLADVLAAYKDRKASIGRAALENCAAIHYELNECFRHPTMRQRFNVCRYETRALDRCYTMNSKFLKALGYLSSLDRSTEEDEAVQMHADTLYTRMLEAEKDAAQAKDPDVAKAAAEQSANWLEKDRDPKGLPSPAESASMAAALARSIGDADAQSSGVPMGRPTELDLLNERARKKLAERTKNMSPLEKEMEERAFAAEIRAAVQTSEQLERHRDEVRARRKERIDAGQTRLMDRVQTFFGW